MRAMLFFLIPQGLLSLFLVALLWLYIPGNGNRICPFCHVCIEGGLDKLIHEAGGLLYLFEMIRFFPSSSAGTFFSDCLYIKSNVEFLPSFDTPYDNALQCPS
jgi:hypothetical protein